MCRSIKRLRVPERVSTDEEVRAAALQFVRKVSGMHHPSKANEAVFHKAIDEITVVTQRLLGELPAPKERPPKPQPEPQQATMPV